MPRWRSPADERGISTPLPQMAHIKFLESEQIHYLREYHTIGRHAGRADTVIEDPYVSKIHAVIEWRVGKWFIKDVSSNGIHINGRKLTSNKPKAIQVNDIIKLSPDLSSHVCVCNLEQPKNLIYRPDNPTVTHVLDDGLLLPNDEDPELGFYRCADSNQWYSEVFDSKSAFDRTNHQHCHGEEIDFQNAKWRFHLIRENLLTKEIDRNQESVDEIHFRFDLSQDEESTTLTLQRRGEDLKLGERTHHYLLAHLVRFKSEQHRDYGNKQATSKDSFGWKDCELIADELGIDESHLNILIFRARKQINSSVNFCSGISRVIERRRRSVRVGINNYSIYKEGIMEA